jgi:hypothetical protein
MSKKFLFAALALAMLPFGQAYGQVTTYRDDFNYTHNFTQNGVPGFNPACTMGGCIWEGIHNQAAAGADIIADAGFITLPQSRTQITQWEGTQDTAPLIYRTVEVEDLHSITLKISSQLPANWSLAGPIVRLHQPQYATPDQQPNENWFAAWSFIPAQPMMGTDFRFQRNEVQVGAESEGNVTALTAADVQYLRIINPDDFFVDVYPSQGAAPAVPQETRRFFAQYSADGTNWLPNPPDVAGGPNAAVGGTSNVDLNEGLVEVGFTAWSNSVLNDPMNPIQTVFDWVEIVTNTGLPDAPINPPDQCGELLCTWNVNASGAWETDGNWDLADGGLNEPTDDPGTNMGWTNGMPFHTAAVRFGQANALAGGQVAHTVYLNANRSVKAMNVASTVPYVFGGPAALELRADTGSASLTVESGSHQVQVDITLGSNANITANPGATLNINAPVFLNGFTLVPTGTVNFNNGQVLAGGAAGGAVVNEGSITGLSSVEGDFSQTDQGSLGVVVGDSPIAVTGAAVLDGVLNVSLADGATLAYGQTYTVLTADSVTDLGLTLAGDLAGLFQLSVGDSSVGLTAVPEPTSMLLMAFGLTVVGLLRRRRNSALSFFGGIKVMPKICTLLSVCTVVLFASSAEAQLTGAPPGALLRTLTDNFDDAGACDFQSGAGCPAYDPNSNSGANIWAGLHYSGIAVPGEDVVIRNGVDPLDSSSKAGKLLISDRSTPLLGWEGDQNDASMLYTLMNAGNGLSAANDFDAIAKIDAQTSGNWSMASIIVRTDVAWPDDHNGTALPATEHYVNVGPFDDGNTLLRKNIVAGAQAEAQSGAFDAAGPTWVRLTKIGTSLQSYWSKDGMAWTASPGGVNNAELGNPANGLQIGLAYMTFSATLQGAAEFDSFQLNVHAPPPPSAIWNVGSGDWFTATNWLALGGHPTPPNSNTASVEFGGTGGASTIFVNSNVTVKTMRFTNGATRAISGAGTLTFAADAGNASITVSNGQHELETPITLTAPLTIETIAGNNQLDIGNIVNMGGQTVTVSGPGEVYFNSNLNGTNGTVNSTGDIGGSGRINGPLNASGGSVNPGADAAGTLTIEGNYTQTGASTALNIELGGTAAGTFDVVSVLGNANLAGVVEVTEVDDFDPALNSTWNIVTTTGTLTSSLTSGNPAYSLSVITGNTLRLTFIGLQGDYNDDGFINAADYTTWRNAVAAGATTLTNRGSGQAGVVDRDDYDVWKAAYIAAAGSGATLGDSTAVPEPTSMTLLLLAAVGACGLIRKR